MNSPGHFGLWAVGQESFLSQVVSVPGRFGPESFRSHIILTGTPLSLKVTRTEFCSFSLAYTCPYLRIGQVHFDRGSFRYGVISVPGRFVLGSSWSRVVSTPGPFGLVVFSVLSRFRHESFWSRSFRHLVVSATVRFKLVISVPGRFGPGSFRPRAGHFFQVCQVCQVAIWSHFGPGSFWSGVILVPGHFGPRSSRSRVVSASALNLRF